MKLHEKAKELGVKTGDLLRYLQDADYEIKSPNQLLTDEQLLAANKIIDAPESSAYNAVISDKTVLAIEMGGNQVILKRVYYKGDKVVLSDVLETSRVFPNATQMYMQVEYLLSRIELGDYNG